MENAPITGCYSFLVCGFNIDRIHELGQLLASSSMGIHVTLKCRVTLSKKSWHEIMVLWHWKNFWWGFQKYTTYARRMSYGWKCTCVVQTLSGKRSTESLWSFIKLAIFCSFQMTYCFCLSCLFLEISRSKEKPAFRIIFLLMPPKT